MHSTLYVSFNHANTEAILYLVHKHREKVNIYGFDAFLKSDFSCLHIQLGDMVVQQFIKLEIHFKLQT